MIRSTRTILWSAALGAGPAVAWAAPSALGLRQGAGEELPASGWYLLVFLGVALLASLSFAWLRRRPARARPGQAALPAWLRRPTLAGAIEVGASARLDLRTSLFTVKWQGQELLLAAGEGGVTVLATHPCAPDIDAGSAP